MTQNPRPHLIALDNDDTVLRAIAEVSLPYYKILMTRQPRTLMGWLNIHEDVAVVITEHVLATAAGVSLLESARTMRPQARRVLMTDYHDLAGIVQGLHTGAIQRVVQKPFARDELVAAILPDGISLSAQVEQRATA